MESLLNEIFDEIVGFHSGFFKKTTKFVWTRSFSALRADSTFHFKYWSRKSYSDSSALNP